VIHRLVGTPEETTMINASIAPEQVKNRAGEEMNETNSGS